MKITIEDIVTLNERGQRSHNEDSLFPEEHLISPDDTMFMVCDGVGANSGGDRVSQLACHHFSGYLLELGDAFQTKDILGNALRYTEECMDEHVNSHPEYEGMATTLAYLKLTDYGAVVAWVGDSRVIQVREGRVIRQTKDHSLVNTLLDYGEITKEEVVVHPKRDVLLRVVSGAGLPVELDTLYIEDIMPGDYFMLCSDGVIEGLGDRLEEVFSNSFSMKPLRNKIDDLCRKNTTDNYSMILLRINELIVEESETGSLDVASPFLKEEEALLRSARVDGPEDVSRRRLRPFLVLLNIVVFIFLGWWWQYSLPMVLKVSSVGSNGIMIRDEGHTVLIDAFPLSDKTQEHQAMEPVRQRMIEGQEPFKEAIFLVSHPPNVESALAESFLDQYLGQNGAVQLHPEMLNRQLRIGRVFFQDLHWQEDELDKESTRFIERLSSSVADSVAASVGFSVFLLRMNNDKTLLYAGAPNVNIDVLADLEEDVDFILINEWNLRQGATRRVLSSKYDDRQLIILSSDRPMNNKQRGDIRNVFPRARFLEEEKGSLRLK